MPDKLDEQRATAITKTDADVSEAQIAVHWKEEEYFYPTAKFVGQANLTDASINERFSSGTTGRPKGCQRGTGGYLAYVAGTSQYIQDIHPEDVYWCMADIGWITGTHISCTALWP
jgi:acyl-coenzyme A synthetase/AMP-(fatty) acid ligase